ncbi:MAG: hypothetical protein IKP77_05520 [Acholeplasmatales bacterium]|nr:hypothetical protein [Acholeplasmatales bacterium]
MKKIKLIICIVLFTFFGVILSSCSNAIDEFKFDKDNVSIEIGESLQLSSVSNETGVINYFSSDETIVTVDKTGKALGVGRGNAIVYALFKNEPYRCNVRVTAQTTNPTVYEREVQLDSNIEKLGVDIKLPGKIQFNGYNTLIAFDESFKMQFEFNLLKAPSTKNGDTVTVTESEQVKKNISTIYLIMSLLNTNSRSANYKKFYDVIKETYYAICDLEGEALNNKIVELKDLTVYGYFTNTYFSLGLLTEGNAKAYIHSTQEVGLLAKIKNIYDTISQFLASGTDLQKIDYIKITESMTGDLLNTETLNKLKQYQNVISTLIYVIFGDLQINKTTMTEGKPDQRLTLTVLSDGVKKINELMANSKIEELKIFDFKAINAVIDISKDMSTNYNNIKNITLNATTNLLQDIDLSVSINMGDILKNTDNLVYKYETKHQEFEKMEVTQ